MKAPPPTERQTQRAILDMLGLHFPRVLVWHVPNGAFLGENEATRRRTMGMLLGDGLKPGAPDLALYWNHGHALIEVKRPGSANNISPAQEAMHETLSDMGWLVRVVTTPEEVYDYLIERGAPCKLTMRRAA